jgi:bifunctional ADP-heptose synthase (sugar kinase/adenylyltransferase)
VHSLHAIVEHFRGCRAAVIGDLMFDEYPRGDVMQIALVTANDAIPG